MRTLLLVIPLLAACVTQPSDRMIARDERDDSWCIGPPSGMWYGDCEDYSFTKKREIGGEVWHVVLPDQHHHAVLLKDGWVFDMLNSSPVAKESYRGIWLFQMEPDPVRVCPSAWSWFR